MDTPEYHEIETSLGKVIVLPAGRDSVTIRGQDFRPLKRRPRVDYVTLPRRDDRWLPESAELPAVALEELSAGVATWARAHQADLDAAEASEAFELCSPFLLMHLRDKLHELAAGLRTQAESGVFKEFGAPEDWLLRQAASLDRHRRRR